MDKLSNFIRQTYLKHPTLVLNVEQVRENYTNFKRHYNSTEVFYAVKANPDRQILQALHELGSSFDAASIGEIYSCISVGVPCSRISFGNTIKSVSDIREAYNLGIILFAADSESELEKIAANAPHSSVYIRLLVQNNEADWPLSRKFGVMPNRVVPLLIYAKRLGLKPAGISFHVGSQTKRPQMWKSTFEIASKVWNEAADAGVPLHLLNIGGGFPVKYLEGISNLPEYSEYILSTVRDNFPGVQRIMTEPGRAIVATAGAIACRVLLVADKGDNSHRWCYLNVGRFSGLAETEAEAIRYRISIPERSGAPELFKLAGPTCDSADILYERNVVSLPGDTSYEDAAIIHDCGAYTSTYSTRNFNGFPPLEVMHI